MWEHMWISPVVPHLEMGVRNRKTYIHHRSGMISTELNKLLESKAVSMCVVTLICIKICINLKIQNEFFCILPYIFCLSERLSRCMGGINKYL